MRIHRLVAILAVLLLDFTSSIVSARAQDAATAHTLRTNGNRFELDGKPFQIISGAIHYPRVPRAYWRDRLRKARAMGLNTVETYVFWNVHETAPGQYDFSGQNDVAEFIREAQQEGLFVILRPGPYVCAEWDFGGYPPWLLHVPGMQVRTSNPAFIAASTSWFHRLGKSSRRCKALMAARSSPCRSRTNMVHLAPTTPTWNKSTTCFQTQASTKRCSTLPTGQTN